MNGKMFYLQDYWNFHCLWRNYANRKGEDDRIHCLKMRKVLRDYSWRCCQLPQTSHCPGAKPNQRAGIHSRKSSSFLKKAMPDEAGRNWLLLLGRELWLCYGWISILTAACVVGQLVATCLFAIRIPQGFPVWQLLKEFYCLFRNKNFAIWLLYNKSRHISTLFLLSDAHNPRVLPSSTI